MFKKKLMIVMLGLVVLIGFMFTHAKADTEDKEDKDKRKIRVLVSIEGNWLNPGPSASYDYGWSMFDEKYTNGQVSAHTHSLEVYEKSLYGVAGNIGVLAPVKVAGIKGAVEIYGGYSYNLIKQKGFLSFTISNLKHLPTTHENPWGYDEVEDFDSQVYSTVTGERNYSISRHQIDLGVGYHLQISSIFQPYAGVGVSRMCIKTEIPKYLVFKEWYSGHLGDGETPDGRYGWAVFVPDNYKVLLEKDYINNSKVETRNEKVNMNLFHFRAGFNLWLEKGFGIFAEAMHIEEVVKNIDFKSEARGSEICYYWLDGNEMWGTVKDERVYSPEKIGEYKLNIGGWKLQAGIRIRF